MPTYIYKREDGTTFEKMQGINADALTECPDTGQKVKRVITGGAGVVYKGDGWYVKDYKNQGKPGSKGKGDEAKEDSSSTKSETKTESKPSGTEKKSEPKTSTDS
jgi:putative FmdB family regulatory protein